MVSNTIKALVALVVLVVLIVAIAAYYGQHFQPSTTTVPATVATTMPVSSATTTIPFNYSSFNSITSQHAYALQQHNISVTYAIESDYPSFTNQSLRTVGQELVTYNRSGNSTMIEVTAYNPAPLSKVQYHSSMQFFDLGGKSYFCNIDKGLDGNIINTTCYEGGSTYPTFANQENRTYITERKGMMLGFMSQLAFSNQTVSNVVSYLGYNASFFHADLSSTANASIRGNVSIYSSSKYDIPLSYLILLNDPLYNNTNNTILISMKMLSLSTSVSSESMVPPYLTGFLHNLSK